MARGLVDPATAALVERQMRNWELARSQRHASPRPREREVEDFVCVSRMVGVGDEVVRLLGKRLGWPVFDRQILTAMAGDDWHMRRVYASLDERDSGWWREILHPLVLEGVSRNDYFRRLCETTLSLARRSSGVFVGRGLDRVLPADMGLRLQLVASLEERVARYAAAHEIDAASARREIVRIEAERATFLRDHFKVEPTDPARFDLTVSVERLPPERAVDLILDARKHYLVRA